MSINWAFMWPMLSMVKRRGSASRLKHDKALQAAYLVGKD